MGQLTTHVLDTVHGTPAKGLAIELWNVSEGSPVLITKAITNADGRLDHAILEGQAFMASTYELRFFVGEYFQKCSGIAPDKRFLDIVPVRFVINNSDDHYHVPLLASPYGYTTYRGS